MSARREQVPQVIGLSALTIGVTNAVAPRAAGRFWDVAPDSSPVVPVLIRNYGFALAGLGGVTLVVGEDDQPAVMRLAAVGASAPPSRDCWPGGVGGSGGAAP